VPLLANAIPRLVARAEHRINPEHLAVINAWRHSDCTDPEHYPLPIIAPSWEGPGTRCHSCARCRPEQRTPVGDWDDWLYMAGRGAGKTRSAAEDMAEAGALNTQWRIAILAPTYADARDTCIEGESGLLAVFDRWGWTDGRDYTWNRSLGELKIHDSRSRYKLFSAEKPARLRGPQHHRAWVDELAQVVRDAPDAWDMLKFGLRLGKHPQVVATTTPLPVQLIKDLLQDPRCAVTRGRTDDNAANLPEVTLRALHRRYDGTRLGRQELDGDLLDDIPGALWKRSWLDDHRLPFDAQLDNGAPDPHAAHEVLAEHGRTLVRIIVAVDPAVTSGDNADETGLIAVGRAADGSFWVLEDATLRDTPDVVMEQVLAVYDRWGANEVILEVNNGGQYIPGMLANTARIAGHPPVPCRSITAKKGKRVRAEPVSALYGQGRVHHLGTFQHLEDQICIWTPEQNESPDRMDALVYGVLYLDDQGLGSAMMTATDTLPRHRGRAARLQMPTSSVRAR
jgi:phage terminase large subunit-like protein